MTSSTIKPVSAVSGWTGIIGMATLFTAVAILKILPQGLSQTEEIFFLLALPATAMALYDVMIAKVHRRDSAGLEWKGSAQKFVHSFFERDLYIKIVGMGISIGFLTFIWNLPLYKDKYYAPYFDFLEFYTVLIVAAGTVYFFFINAAMQQRRDGFWHIGALFIPRLSRDVSNDIIKTHLLSLCVKAFFLPLMFIFMFNQWGNIKKIGAIPKDFPRFFDTAIHSIFFLDVAFAVIGYICTLRLFDAHVRKPDTRWGGWIFCLICYAPFNQVIFDQFLKYQDNFGWKDWLLQYPTFYMLWGSLLIFSYGIYVMATVNFGLRFSNLTDRGVLTHGMYAHTKHPAYISKNFSWWLEEIPFIATSFTLGIKHCVLLCLVNFIYYKRAKYEEKMLAENNETYRQYAAYIDEHGIIARVKRFFKRIVRRRNPKTTPIEN